MASDKSPSWDSLPLMDEDQMLIPPVTAADREREAEQARQASNVRLTWQGRAEQLNNLLVDGRLDEFQKKCVSGKR